MASAFNLTAQLNLQGPTNINAIVGNIRRQIGNISANVNVNINPNTNRNIAGLQRSFTAFNATLATTAINSNNAARAITNLSAAIGRANNPLNNLQRNLQTNAVAAQQLTQNLNTLQRNTRQTANAWEDFGRQGALAVRRFAAFATVTSVIYKFGNAINSAAKDFVDFNRELVRVAQVTGNSVSQLNGLVAQITELSTKFGVTSESLIQVSSTLAQAGLSARDTEKALKALALSALAPSFDSMNDTVEGSIALMRQFGISADQLESALGSVNAVAAKFAVEASDIITAIQRTGGVFAAASRGVSEGTQALNEFIAVFTSVRATTRESAETIATGLRTIFTRIQRTETIDALRLFGVTLTDLEGKFVGPFEAVKRLSEGLGRLDPRDLKFAQIVEELGGFRQIGKVIPLIQQFATAQQALKVAQTGQASLAIDAAIAQESVANKITKVREEFVALIRSIGQSTEFQTFIKLALDLTSGLIRLADAAKGVLPAITALAAIRGAGAAVSFGRGFLGGIRGGARGFATGGLVPGTGSGDTYPAMLTPGEFVIRKKAAQSIGLNNLESMNRYAKGGIVKMAKGGDFESKLAAGRNIALTKNKKYTVKAGPETLPESATNTFGAVFLKPVGRVANLTGSVKLPGKEGGRQKIDLRVGSLDSQLSTTLLENLKSSVLTTINTQASRISNSLGAQLPPVESEQLLNQIGFPNILGRLFEGVLSRIGGVYRSESSAAFDFQSLPGNLQGKFGNAIGMGNFPIDAKSSFNADSIRSILKKAESTILARNKTLATAQKQQTLEKAIESGSIEPRRTFSLKELGMTKEQAIAAGYSSPYRGKWQKRAKGGSIQDTVPALLTPGEYVINKDSASKLGLGTLNTLNNIDKVQGFNSGGPVQRFRRGGRSFANRMYLRGRQGFRNISERFQDNPGLGMGLVFGGGAAVSALSEGFGGQETESGRAVSRYGNEMLTYATLGSAAGPLGALAGAAVGAAKAFYDAKKATEDFAQSQREANSRRVSERSGALINRYGTSATAENRDWAFGALEEAGQAADAVARNVRQETGRTFFTDLINNITGYDISQPEDIMQTRRRRGQSYTEVSQQGQQLATMEMERLGVTFDELATVLGPERFRALVDRIASADERYANMRDRTTEEARQYAERVARDIMAGSSARQAVIQAEKRYATAMLGVIAVSEQLGDKMMVAGEVLNRFSFEISSLKEMTKLASEGKAFGPENFGLARMSNVLENPLAYSQSYRAQVRAQAGNIIGGTTGGQVAQYAGLGEDLTSFVNRFMTTVNPATNLGEAATVLSSQLGQQIEAALGNSPAAQQLAESVQQAVAGASAGLRSGDPLAVQAFKDKALEALKPILDISKQANEILGGSLKALSDSFDALSDNARALAKVDAEIVDRNRKLFQIQSESMMNQREALGETITPQERIAERMGQLRFNLGGMDPTAANMGNLLKDLYNRRNIVGEQLEIAQSTGDADAIHNLTMQMESLDIAVGDVEGQLSTLPQVLEQNIGDLLAEIRSNVQFQQKTQEARLGVAETIVTSTPEEIYGLNQAYAVMSAGVSGFSRTIQQSTAAQRAYYETAMKGGTYLEAVSNAQQAYANESRQALQMFDEMVQVYGLKGQQVDLMRANLLESLARGQGTLDNPMIQAVLTQLRMSEQEKSQQKMAENQPLLDAIAQNRKEQEEAVKQLNDLAYDNQYQLLWDTTGFILEKIRNLQIDINLRVQEFLAQQGFGPAPAAAPAPVMANGGLVYAAGGRLVNFQSKGTDTVPAMLTPGEFVVNARSTKNNLGLLKSINSSGYARGGIVYLQAGNNEPIENPFLPGAFNFATGTRDAPQQQVPQGMMMTPQQMMAQNNPYYRMTPQQEFAMRRRKEKGLTYDQVLLDRQNKFKTSRESLGGTGVKTYEEKLAKEKEEIRKRREYYASDPNRIPSMMRTGWNMAREDRKNIEKGEASMRASEQAFNAAIPTQIPQTLDPIVNPDEIVIDGKPIGITRPAAIPPVTLDPTVSGPLSIPTEPLPSVLPGWTPTVFPPDSRGGQGIPPGAWKVRQNRWWERPTIPAATGPTSTTPLSPAEKERISTLRRRIDATNAPYEARAGRATTVGATRSVGGAVGSFGFGGGAAIASSPLLAAGPLGWAAYGLIVGGSAYGGNVLGRQASESLLTEEERKLANRMPQQVAEGESYGDLANIPGLIAPGSVMRAKGLTRPPKPPALAKPSQTFSDMFEATAGYRPGALSGAAKPSLKPSVGSGTKPASSSRLYNQIDDATQAAFEAGKKGRRSRTNATKSADIESGSSNEKPKGLFRRILDAITLKRLGYATAAYGTYKVAETAYQRSSANKFQSGGLVYANNGMFVPKGSDTVPAMLTPGEFVVNRSSTQKNLSTLQAINGGYFAAGGLAGDSSMIRNAITTKLSSDKQARDVTSLAASVRSVVTALNQVPKSGTIQNLTINNNAQQQIDRRLNLGVLGGGYGDRGEVGIDTTLLELVFDSFVNDLNNMKIPAFDNFLANIKIVKIAAFDKFIADLMFLNKIPAFDNFLNGMQAMLAQGIVVQGKHDVNVIINGGGILQNLLSGPIGQLVHNAVQEAFAAKNRQNEGQ